MIIERFIVLYTSISSINSYDNDSVDDDTDFYKAILIFSSQSTFKRMVNINILILQIKRHRRVKHKDTRGQQWSWKHN